MDSIERCKIERTVRMFPVFAALSYDLIMFVPIDMFFLTMTKGLSAAQISAMTLASLVTSLLLQKVILSTVSKIGNVKAVQLSIVLLEVSLVFLILGNSFALIALYRVIRDIAKVFGCMCSVTLMNNLKCIGKENEFYSIMNKSSIVYIVAAQIATVISSYLFNCNNYLPVVLIVLFGASFFMYEQPVERLRRRCVSSHLSLVLFCG